MNKEIINHSSHLHLHTHIVEDFEQTIRHMSRLWPEKANGYKYEKFYEFNSAWSIWNKFYCDSSF